MPTQEYPDPHHFTSEQWVPWPVEIVFAFFAMPENLPRIMPRWQRARIEEANFTAPPARPASAIVLKSFAAGTGTRITISFRPFPLSPIRLPWRARIHSFTWNDSFCDLQEQGPFAYWDQCHLFRAETRDGIAGTVIRDEIEYVLPLGSLGVLANKLVVARQLRAMFAYRHTATLLWLDRVAAPYKSA